MKNWRRIAIATTAMVASAVLFSTAAINCGPQDIVYYPRCEDAGAPDGGTDGAGGSGGSECL